MDDTPAPRPPRGRHPRPAAARVHLPARAAGGRSHGLASPRRLLAEQIVAWHNRHPLARRIGRRQLHGFGVLSLPFSPALAAQAGDGAGDGAPSTQSGGSGWAESASGRFPMFDELPFLRLPLHKVVALALAEGWVERPGAPEWPLRRVPVGKGWDAAQAEPLYLLTACIERGRGRAPLRVLVGRHGPAPGPAPARPGASTAVPARAAGAARADAPAVIGVVGHRALSWPRMGLAGLVASLPLLLGAWGAVTLIQQWRPTPAPPPLAQGPLPQGETPAAAAPAPPAMRPTPLPGMAPAAPPLAGVELPAPAEPAPALPGPRAMPKVGPVLAAPPPTRAAAPTTFRLMAVAERDPAALQRQALRLQAVLDTLGHTGARLRLDVVGTPDGDALAISPPLDQAEAERVAKRLRARGFVFTPTPQ